ncbi:DUF2889 domain-containing protein [Marinobacterium mangrovicola]|uniref:DUF2889 family protein n=1 Tax=Marinobacterium mangrovicola TaxID=1476959 RepID=A0A4R1GBY3_9GAMM|nr:DUF2889 domain-containing protein [Marinobacterium mangrovicola]TCK04313.1 Protein of unknown function (DUF2889) [Marinobacterium mangrovicola]
MPGSLENTKRTLVHNRNIDVRGYIREDGLWEVEAVLGDTKSHIISLPDRGDIPVGEHLHYMSLALALDESLTIKEVRARMEDTPHADCPGAERSYQALVGVRIGSGWLDEAKAAIGRVAGCTHLTELLPVLATAAIQTIHGYKLQHIEGFGRTEKDKQRMLNSCFGFRQEGRAVAHIWPDSKQGE